MKIVLVNHYAVPPTYYPLARPSLFAKNLIRMGQDVTIVAASSIHNSNCENLIHGKESVLKINNDGIPYVLIKCSSYKGNGFRRVINILEFARKLPKVLATFKNVDAIIATSFDPISCYSGIKFAKKNGIKAIAEIADLWPETLIDYSGISPRHPLVKYLRRIEKKIYTLSDAVVFTMEGGYDYIVKQKWDKLIPKDKCFYINNGIDLEQFKYNYDNYQIHDEDLLNKSLFKIVYTGSIRKVNNLGLLLDTAKLVHSSKIIFLVWGDGDELSFLKERLVKEKIKNVIFKGRVDKKYVPFITCNADLNIAHNAQSNMFYYGISFNKIFDYLAAGKPILCDFDSKYNPVIQFGAGIETKSSNPYDIARAIQEIVNLDQNKYEELSKNALKAANDFDFKFLTQKLIEVIEGIRGTK